MSALTVRTLDAGEVERLVDWAAAEGWNPGLNDAAAFRAGDPDGFIGAFVDGEMVAGISAVAYGRAYGFVGLYIARPDMRGRGYGKAVWQAGMARLAGRTIGLDGVDEQFENYRGKGFEPSYRTTRFGGRLADRPVETPSVRIVQFEASFRTEVAAFDLSVFPEERGGFLELWLSPPHIVRLALSGEGRVIGYGVLRQCRSGWKIGGLSAVDEETAIMLMRALAAEIRGGDLYIDVPADRRGFIDFLTDAGLLPGFETTRMYVGGAVPLSPRLFGVTTLELG